MVSPCMILGDLSNLKEYHTANAEDQCIRLIVPREETPHPLYHESGLPNMHEVAWFYVFVMNQTYALCIRSID